MEGSAFSIILRAMPSGVSITLRARHGGKVEGEKQTKSNLTNVEK